MNTAIQPEKLRCFRAALITGFIERDAPMHLVRQRRRNYLVRFQSRRCAKAVSRTIHNIIRAFPVYWNPTL